MKRLIVAALAVCFVVGGVYYWKNRQRSAEADAPESTTATVERGPLVLSVSTTGRVVPNLEVEIKCKASGEVIMLPYDVSDPVRKGDLLVELDPINEQRLVRQAEVALSASEARLVQAGQNLLIAEEDLASGGKRAEAALKSAEAAARDADARRLRTQRLFDEDLASREVYDAAETAWIRASADLDNARIRLEELKTEELALELKRQDVRLADSQVESDRIDLLNARQRLKDTKVVAPIDGVVSSRNVQIGQITSSGISNVGGGTTVLMLADLSRLYVLASVDESDIGAVKVGQSAVIRTDAFPNNTFNGEVVRVATTGVNTSNVVTFEAKVELLGEDKSLLKPEMTATLEIIIAERESALFIPAEAVYAEHEGRFALVLKEDGTTEKRPIEIGINTGIDIEIVSGLTEGETIVILKHQAESRWRSAQEQRRSYRASSMIFRRSGKK